MSAHDAPPLLIDHDAERGLIGCMLENVQPPELDPIWITDDGRRLIYLTATTLMGAGLLLAPEDYGNAGGCWRTAKANAEVVAFTIDRMRTWPNYDGPRWELIGCMSVSTWPGHADWYVKRLKEAATRRWLVDRARECARMAIHPAPLDPQEVAKCLAS